MRTKTLISIAILALTPLPSIPFAVYAQSGTAEKAGEYIGDSALTTKVKAALLAEKNLKSLPISVETTDGVVTLSGEVVSSAQITQAVDVAKHVKGVKDVHNALQVKMAK